MKFTFGPSARCGFPLRVSDSHGLCIRDVQGEMVADGDPQSTYEYWTASRQDLDAVVHRANNYIPLLQYTMLLERAIRRHRDAQGHDRCWELDAELYAVLGEPVPERPLPPKCEFLAECEKYYELRRSK